ncbi:MAG: OsmC family protein [Bacteroidetes bacterium]|nr:OsmC family protein [Bacteroidota bacterium]
MSKQHHYAATITWTGNKGEGTIKYDAYERAHTLSVTGKPDILCSSDTPFRGDGSKYNPEDMLLYSLSSCHMLWYLHLCADAGVIVTDYVDEAKGTLTMDTPEGARFTEVKLYPVVTVADASMIDKANELHDKAHRSCFIAKSVNFPVGHEPKAVVK